VSGSLEHFDEHARDAEDERLIAAGEFGQLLAAYYPQIFQILRVKRASWDDAEEVRQRVVEHLLAELQRGKKYTTQFRVVFYQRTKWMLSDYYAENKRQPAELVHDPVSEAPDSFAGVESDMEFERRVSALPKRERQVVELRWRHGLDAETIAEMIGIDANAVHQALFRAHAKVRKASD
jgi:RNA polymerase sigma factor (sigma-70 family)